VLTIWLLGGTLITPEGPLPVRYPETVQLDGAGRLHRADGTVGILRPSERAQPSPGGGLMLVAQRETELLRPRPDGGWSVVGAAWPGGRLSVRRLGEHHAEVVISQLDPPLTVYVERSDLGADPYPLATARHAVGGEPVAISAPVPLSGQSGQVLGTLAPGTLRLLEERDGTLRVSRMWDGVAIEGLIPASTPTAEADTAALPWGYTAAMPAADAAAVLSAALAEPIWWDTDGGCVPHELSDGAFWAPPEPAGRWHHPAVETIQRGAAAAVSGATVGLSGAVGRGWRADGTEEMLSMPIVLCRPPPHTLVAVEGDRLVLARQWTGAGRLWGYDPRRVVVWYRSREACEGAQAVASLRRGCG